MSQKKRGRSPGDDIEVNELKRGKNAQDTRKRKPSPNNNKSKKTQKHQHNTYSASINIIDDKTHILNIKYDNKTSAEINLVELYEKIKTNKKGIFPDQLDNPRKFFEYVFYTDALKDNCPIKILKNIIKGVNGAILQELLDSNIKISGDEIKTKAKSVIRKCLDNFELISKDILRFGDYKKNIDPDITKEIINSFLGCELDIIYDCGLDPSHIMNVKVDQNGSSYHYKKTGNIASDLFDAHSSSESNEAFPKKDYTLEMDESVFEYFLPRKCVLNTTTGQGSTKYTSNSSFTVNGVDMIGNKENIKKYFAGNTEKKAQFKNTENQTDIEENARLVIGKYIGDFLQIFIHFIKSKTVEQQTCKVISTCDMIVFLRAYFFGLACFLFSIDGEGRDSKITHFYISNPNLSTDLAPKYIELKKIFDNEKKLIIAEYDRFISLVEKIQKESSEKNFNNICVVGTYYVYKFSNDFYDAIKTDFTNVRDAIKAYSETINQDSKKAVDIANISAMRNNIDYLRACKVNDLFKRDKNNIENEYYVISRAINCTTGMKNKDIYAKIFPQGFKSNTEKSNNASYLDIGISKYLQNKQTGAGLSDTVSNINYGGSGKFTQIEYVMNIYFNMDAYKDAYKCSDNCITEKGIDLHEQFYGDFTKIFNEYKNAKNIQNYFLLIKDLYKQSYDLDIANIELFIFFDCFSNAINSIYLLDLENLHVREKRKSGESIEYNEYYSEKSIKYLIDNYFHDNVKSLTKVIKNMYRFYIKNNPEIIADFLHQYKSMSMQKPIKVSKSASAMAKKRVSAIAKKRVSARISARASAKKSSARASAKKATARVSAKKASARASAKKASARASAKKASASASAKKASARASAKKASASASAKKASASASAKGASAMDTVMDVITKGSKV